MCEFHDYPCAPFLPVSVSQSVYSSFQYIPLNSNENKEKKRFFFGPKIKKKETQYVWSRFVRNLFRVRLSFYRLVLFLLCLCGFSTCLFIYVISFLILLIDVYFRKYLSILVLIWPFFCSLRRPYVFCSIFAYFFSSNFISFC